MCHEILNQEGFNLNINILQKQSFIYVLVARIVLVKKEKEHQDGNTSKLISINFLLYI